MKITNKDVIQSYLITSARYDFNVYQKRILYMIICTSQRFLDGQKIGQKITVNKDLFGDYRFTIPIKSLLSGEEDNNYYHLKKALEDLENKKFTYNDGNLWTIIRFIQNPEIIKHSGFFSFRLNPMIYDALLNFSKGYTKFELVTAMGFESIYTMRFYEMMSGQKTQIKYSLDKLKQMFNLSEKYKLTADFIRRTIDVAKKELDKKSPYSFEYSLIKEGRKIVGFNFYPVYIAKNRDPELESKSLQNKTSIRWDLDVKVINHLKQKFDFTETEIKNNRDLFAAAQNSSDFDLMTFLSESVRKSNSAQNPKGWIIGAIKKQLGV